MGMDTRPSRKCVVTYHVKECNQCPQLSPGIYGVRDDYCKELRAFLPKGDEYYKNCFPITCPLSKE
jgi:hypothetical protein